MQTAILYAVTAILFLGIDAVGLRYIVKPVFDRHIEDMLADPLRLAPAAAFYLFYIVGLLYFVSVPAMRAGTGLGAVFLRGALFGAVAYGTYEFTNLATLRGWTWSMVATDLAWGTLLTGTAAAAGVAIVRAFG